MTPDQKRKYILLPMLIIGLTALIIMAILRGFYDINPGIWQYVVVPLWIGLFLVAYINCKKRS